MVGMKGREAVEKVLQVEGLSKNFGGVRAVDNLSFDVERGQICAIIGPNGSGKTTCINMITGGSGTNFGPSHVHGPRYHALVEAGNLEVGHYTHISEFEAVEHASRSRPCAGFEVLQDRS